MLLWITKTNLGHKITKLFPGMLVLGLGLGLALRRINNGLGLIDVFEM